MRSLFRERQGLHHCEAAESYIDFIHRLFTKQNLVVAKSYLRASCKGPHYVLYIHTERV